jgi:hypothetical protein
MADDGGLLEAQLQFVRGMPTRGKAAPKIHSAEATATFSRL